MMLAALMLLLLMGQAAFAAEGSNSDDMGMGDMVDGDIVHTEFYARDLAEAQAFYGGLFGWTFVPMDEMYVTFMDASGEHGGGFTTMSEGTAEVGRMTTTIYIYCSDIDAKLAEIEAAGGSLMVPRTPIPMIGEFAIFGDPSGNPVGLFSAGGGEMPAEDPHAGHDHGDHAGHNH
jgi:predicted enzyme related to lactoylglutathione lyase